MRKVGSLQRLAVGGAVLTAFTAMALVASSLAGAAKVEPEFLPGASNQGKDCVDNDGAGQTWIQLKVDPNANGVYSDGTLTITVSNTQNDKTFDWSSNIGVDAVIVKGGSDGTYLYRYDPPSEQTSDTGLTTPGENGISHINFCYDVPPRGSLTVIKKVVNDDGGDAESGDWTMNVDGPTDLAFAGADDPGTTSTVDAGSYTVTESGGPSGYALTYSGDCNAQGNVTVPDNGSATCTLTNDDNEAPPPPENGTIVVEKQTIPDGYQPPQGGFRFTGEIEAVLNDGETASKEVAPGTYSVSEVLDGRPFWDLISLECDDEDSSGDLATQTATYEVDAAETVTCTFTNRKRSLLIIQKETNPDGAEGSFDFEASYDADGFSLSDGEQIATPLQAGDYSVTEDVPEGWELESATCDNGDTPDSIDLPEDTLVTCTFTNRLLPEPGTIIVEKETVPDGDDTSFEFSFGEGGFDLSDGEQEIIGDLDAGTYSVSENTPEGWVLTDATCSDQSDPEQIELSAGETVTCTFTNTKLATIIVEKQTSPDGSSGEFGFTGDADGSIGDGQQIVVSGLEAGTYTSTEDTAAGWLLTSIECDDEDSDGDLGSHTATFEVDAGETVTCVFTNAQLTTGRGSISISKSASTTSVKEPGGPVSYSVTIRNTSDVDVAITNVVDDKFGDLDDSGGNGCFDVPVNLDPGASVNCQFTGQVTGSAGTDHVNVVCADAVDEFGNALKGCDDARVSITPLLIDLVMVKNASSPTPLNGVVNYSLTVTNKGPDTATNVQVADPAPAGITYLTASPSQGTCNLSASLVTCSLGSLAAGQSVTIAITARATSVGSHTNTATVTGGGGRETNPADNVDSAVTLVPAPLRPPVAQPKPKPSAEVCLSLTVSPKMIKADGKPDKATVKVTAGAKRVKGVRVSIRGSGVAKTARSNGKGVAVLRVNPKKPGILTVSVVETNRKLCGAKRIGVVGVFLPPLTG